MIAVCYCMERRNQPAVVRAHTELGHNGIFHNPDYGLLLLPASAIYNEEEQEGNKKM